MEGKHRDLSGINLQIHQQTGKHLGKLQVEREKTFSVHLPVKGKKKKRIRVIVEDFVQWEEIKSSSWSVSLPRSARGRLKRLKVYVERSERHETPDTRRPENDGVKNRVKVEKMYSVPRHGTHDRRARPRSYRRPTNDDGYFSVSDGSDNCSVSSQETLAASDRSLDLPQNFQHQPLMGRNENMGFVDVLKNGDPIAVAVVFIAIAAVLYIVIFGNFSTRERVVIQDVTIVLPSSSGDSKNTLQLENLMDQVRTKVLTESDSKQTTYDTQSPGIIMSIIKLLFQLVVLVMIISLAFHVGTNVR